MPRKSIIALAAVGLVSFGFAGSASAFTFSPTGTNFTATGLATLVYSPNGSFIECTSTFTGHVNSSGSSAKITAFQSAGSDPRCASIVGANLPWKAAPKSANHMVVKNFEVTADTFFCGPGPVNGTLIGGEFAFDVQLPPTGCAFRSNRLITSPTLSIVP